MSVEVHSGVLPGNLIISDCIMLCVAEGVRSVGDHGDAVPDAVFVMLLLRGLAPRVTQGAVSYAVE